MSDRAPSMPADTARPDPADLLAWYDRHRRNLPWRAAAGETADPYAVWLSEIMLQQTGVATVAGYFERFLARWPTVEALAAAPVEDVMGAWAGLGYYSRARNLHACAQAIVSAHGGRFPADEAALARLPGVGPYTAAAIAAIAFGRAASPVDGNIERVVARLFAITTALPAAKADIRAAARTLVPDHRPGDAAQAMMDLGATICAPRSPACGLCPFRDACRARALGMAEDLPRKAARTPGKPRFGASFVLTDPAGRLLVRRRPPRGLLGGMLETPGTAWSAAFDPAGAVDQAPMAADWRMIAPPVQHVFTHFSLALTVYRAGLAAETGAPDGMWWLAPEAIAGEAFPTLFRKVIAAAR